MKAFAALVVLFLGLALSACTTFTPDISRQSQAIYVGMSKAQVMAVMGAPERDFPMTSVWETRDLRQRPTRIANRIEVTFDASGLVVDKNVWTSSSKELAEGNRRTVEMYSVTKTGVTVRDEYTGPDVRNRGDWIRPPDLPRLHPRLRLKAGSVALIYAHSGGFCSAGLSTPMHGRFR